MARTRRTGQGEPNNAGRDSGRRRRGALAYVGLALFALALILLSVLTMFLAPLFALACGSCEHGVRQPAFEELVLFLPMVVAPVTALGTAAAMFAARRGALVGFVGLLAQGVIFPLTLLLARLSA